jgi:methyl-accepting chemotaxis protein
MKMRLDALVRPRVATRILLGFGFVLLLLASFGGLLHFAITSLHATMEAEAKLADSAVEILDIKGRFSEMRRAVESYVQSGSEETYDQAIAHEDGTRTRFEDALKHDQLPETKAKLESALVTFSEYSKRLGELATLRRNLDKAITQDMNPTAERLVSSVHRIIRIADARDDYDMVSLAGSAQNHLQSARLGVANFQLTLNPSLAPEVLQKLTAFKASLNSLRLSMKTDQEKATLQTLVDDVNRYEASFQKVRSGALATKDKSQEAAITYADVLSAALEEIKARQWRLIEDDRQHLSALMSKLLLVLGGAVVAALAIGIGISIITGRSVVGPLQGMTNAMTSLAAGNLDARIPAEDRTDELGQMAKAVGVFRDAAIENKRLEQAAASARVAAEAERIRAQEDAIASERALVTRSIGEGLSRLASKDLTARLSNDLPEAYAKLRDDFNAAMAEIESALHAVAHSGATIASSTSEISASADDLSRRTEQQAASLEETAAALDEITATSRKAAAGAEHAREVVTAAKADAETTGQVVRRTVQAIGDIEKSAQQISQIIGVIDEIAFQTNLLALNAGVEAARAGDAGRGFAVVASEVRALAQRSAEAAKEIKSLISKSTTQVSEGVTLVAQTGQALQRILSQVQDITSVVTSIASGAQEQAAGLAQVNTAISQMDQSTQQNAAMVEETTAASHTLSQESQQLGTLIAEFRMSQATEMDQSASHGRRLAA